jgi:hypothetical protein
MKKRNSSDFVLTSMLFLLILISAIQCSKKEKTPDDASCKVCKAIGGPDNGTIQKEVCTEAEEAAFRSENAGKEIECH